VVNVKFRVGQHVRISKEKMKFAKGGEQIFSTEVFRSTKFIERWPRTIYELEDLNKSPIEGEFYGEVLTPVRISKHITYKINKILDKRVRFCIMEYLVRWRGYSQDFYSWIPESRVNDI